MNEVDGVTFAARAEDRGVMAKTAEYHVAREAARVARRLGLECMRRHCRNSSIARTEGERQLECLGLLILRAVNNSCRRWLVVALYDNTGLFAACELNFCIPEARMAVWTPTLGDINLPYAGIQARLW